MKRTSLPRRPPKRAPPGKQATTITASMRRLRQTRSTGKPTVVELERLLAVKRLGCICCAQNRNRGMATAGFGPCEAHHLLSGGRRRGHAYTIGLCPWHHRGVRPYQSITTQQTIATCGPSVATGSKAFHAMYGTDDELLALQAALLTAARGR